MTSRPIFLQHLKHTGTLVILLAANIGNAELFLHTNHKCVSPIERREIHIYIKSDELVDGVAPGGEACKMDYVKGGLTETLWTAAQDPYYCKAKARELIEDLEETGFKCVSTAESAQRRAEINAKTDTPEPAAQVSVVDTSITDLETPPTINAVNVEESIEEVVPSEQAE